MKPMSKKRPVAKLIWLVIGIMFLIGAGYYWWNNLSPQAEQTKIDKINSFEECAAAGKPVMESYPEQCIAGDKHFVRDISNEYLSEKGVRIIVNSPKTGATVNSPITITGEVPGNWSFEASFTIELQTENGVVVASTVAQLQEDWMTEGLVPFTAEIKYTDFGFASSSNQAKLVLKKDNPSGLTKNDDSVTVPIVVNG